MAYRDEDGLDRRAALIDALSRPQDDDARDALMQELAVADRARRIAARRLPLVASARIASPCPEIWETMQGDGPIRACSRCDKEVFDLGAMTLAAADALIRGRAGEKTCVRLHRRSDGTMMFADCEVGASGIRTRRIGVALASLAIGASVVAATAKLDARFEEPHHARTYLPVDDPYRASLADGNYGSTIMGEMASFPIAPSEDADAPPVGEPGYILTSPPRTR